MSEKIGGVEKKPRIVRQFRKPKDEPGVKWVPVRDDPWKRNRRTGWMAVSTEHAPSPPETEGLLEEPPLMEGNVTAEQLEESRKRYFPSIEDSLPTGDRD